MFGESGKTSKGERVPRFFLFHARQKSLFKMGSGVTGCESGMENACGIGIRLMSDIKRGVGVMWRGNNGEERLH